MRGERSHKKASYYAMLARRKADSAPLRWKALYDLGVELCNSGQFEESARTFMMCLAENPEHFATYTNLGYVLTEIGSFAAAERVLLSALATIMPPMHISISASCTCVRESRIVLSSIAREQRSSIRGIRMRGAISVKFT